MAEDPQVISLEECHEIAPPPSMLFECIFAVLVFLTFMSFYMVAAFKTDLGIKVNDNVLSHVNGMSGPIITLIANWAFRTTKSAIYEKYRGLNVNR